MYSILFSSDIKFQTACPSQDNAKISDETFLPQKLVVSALEFLLSRQHVFVGSLERLGPLVGRAPRRCKWSEMVSSTDLIRVKHTIHWHNS